MTIKLRADSIRAGIVAGVLGAGIAGFTGPAAAQSTDQQSAPSSEAPAVMQELRAKQQEMRQLMGELRQIQQQATQSNPELAAQQEDYRDLVMNTMSDQNFDPEAELQNMRSLQAELRGNDQLGEEERQAKMQELQQKKQQFRSKQQEAMQTEDVQTAREQLDQDMRDAMKEQSPKAADLIARLDELQKEYQNLLQKAMQQQQQGGAGSSADEG